MFDWIEMHIVNMCYIIRLISYQVLPVSSLPGPSYTVFCLTLERFSFGGVDFENPILIKRQHLVNWIPGSSIVRHVRSIVGKPTYGTMPYGYCAVCGLFDLEKERKVQISYEKRVDKS